ncbi:MAG: amino acid permease, partial [Chloroflexota bacterium]
MATDTPTVEANTKQREPAGNSAARFGTFAGVFTPNVLTILGLILFLRIGYVTAYAGMWHTLIIVLIANGISFLTGLSLSAIATSMEVRAGGNYYILSRSLGLEVGGAIGIPLFASQAISVAFYIIGFTESAQSLVWFQQFDPRLISTAIALLFIVIAWIGADFAIKIQFGILAVLTAALISFFAGGWDTISEPILEPAYADGITFWVAFAIFFPAVTGITVGTSMSGDLKDPDKAIPNGTISSIVITAVIYVGVVVWFSFHAPDRQELINNSMAIQSISIFPPLILAGVWASTLSSALGSIVAAPRTLQAIGKDRMVPTWTASNLGHPTEPRMAVLITGAIALIVIWMGDLNAVAPVISMFFLNTYGITNLAAGIEKLVDNPSYRPRFNIPWYWSMLGALGCYGTMFLISPTATVIAIVISVG